MVILLLCIGLVIYSGCVLDFWMVFSSGGSVLWILFVFMWVMNVS